MSSFIFLGTAGDTAMVSKQARSSGGMVFAIEDMQFLIDPGPGTLQRARELGINLHHTTAVLVSHHHLNHCNDLNAVVDAMTHGGIEHRGVVIASKSVLQESPDHYPILTKYHQSLLEKVIPLEKSHKVGIELIEINAISAEHGDATAVGFKFFCPKFTLSYTGDTALTSQLMDDLAGTDILVMNVTFPGTRESAGHLNTDAAIKIISKIQPKVAIMTHFGVEMMKADPIAEAREVQRITGIPTIAAKDGLVVTPESHVGRRAPVKGYV